MTSTPTVTTLSEVRDGDLHVYRRTDGTWSDPCTRLAHEPGDHGRLPAVILGQARPWPDAPLIYVRAARRAGEPMGGLPDVASRDSDGDYAVRDAYLIRDREGDSIDDYEPVVPLLATVVSRLLAAVDADTVDGRTAAAWQAARFALAEAVDE